MKRGFKIFFTRHHLFLVILFFFNSLLNSDEVTLEVEILNYIEANMVYTYDEGDFEWFDLVILKIIPEGPVLNFFVNTQDTVSVEAWNAPGSTYLIECTPETWRMILQQDESDQFFIDSIKIIEEKK